MTGAALSDRCDEADLASLVQIRAFETAVLDAYRDGFVHGTTHTCLGQEQVAVSLAKLLGHEDFLVCGHRAHGHYLARFDDPRGLLAELLGRPDGVCGGFGGSQHVLRDRFLSTGVQGEAVPVAAGMALRCKRNGLGEVAVAVIGDGTWGQGAVYEALNLARIWSVPLVVVTENNQIAQSTPRVHVMAGDIAGRAAAFDVSYVRVRSNDPLRAAAQLREPILRTRAGAGPLVVEFTVDRLGPHSKGDDTRSAGELERLRRDDWLACYLRCDPRVATALAESRRHMTDLVRELAGSRGEAP